MSGNHHQFNTNTNTGSTDADADDADQQIDEISPSPYVCVETHLFSEEQQVEKKIFINLLTHDAIQPLQEVDPSKLPKNLNIDSDTMSSDAVLAVRLPLSINPPFECTDSKDHPALVFDVVMNTDVLHEAYSDGDNDSSRLISLCQVILQELETRYETKTSGKISILKDVKYRGELPPPVHTIRSESDNPDMGGRERKKDGPLVTEIGGDAGGDDHKRNVPFHEWLVSGVNGSLGTFDEVPVSQRNELVLKMSLPSINAANQLDLEVTDEYISLEGPGVELSRFPIPESKLETALVISEKSTAKFDKRAKVLSVVIPLDSELETDVNVNGASAGASTSAEDTHGTGHNVLSHYTNVYVHMTNF